jgi:hypothetical protein
LLEELIGGVPLWSRFRPRSLQQLLLLEILLGVPRKNWIWTFGRWGVPGRQVDDGGRPLRECSLTTMRGVRLVHPEKAGRMQSSSGILAVEEQQQVVVENVKGGACSLDPPPVV